MTYQRFPIETDPDALAQDSYQLLSDKTSGVWQPADGNLDTWLIEATARQAAEVRDVAADVPDTIFMTYGQTLVNLPPYQATSAQAVLNVTLRDQAAYLIPAGTTFGVDDLAGTPHAFALQENASIPASSSGPATPVVVLAAFALEPGSDASGIDPRPGNAYLLDAITAIISVELSETTSGGSDGESDQDYMNRLAETLQLLTPRPVLAVDYAKLALQVPGVGYACAVNLYNPGPPPATNVERCVTVILTDPAGQPVSSTIKSQVDDLLQSLRPANQLVFEKDAGYVTIAVAYTVAVTANFDPVGVLAACTATLEAYLSPASFAAANQSAEVAGLFTPQAAVRLFDVGLQLQSVDGVDHVTTLTLNGSAADVTLPAPCSLPEPGTITGAHT